MTARGFRDEMLRIVANEGDSNTGDAIREALRLYAPLAPCCADGHDYQPRHEEQLRSPCMDKWVTVAVYLGDRCARCGDWALDTDDLPVA